MNKTDIKLPDSYEIIKEKKIEELDSDGFLLRHKKTGARVVLLSNSDINKVFSIGFRTPVSDDTGVPHIIEHSVLCGSKKYPVKDPFMELIKGSLNTFLNAMTFPDKTVYPIASCNDKDFQNLMNVYLDAVFCTNIYEHEEIFRQEGWHYELSDREGDITCNGVVYNEMKGAFSSIDGILDRAVLHSLFPDTTYGYESGGDPDHIPELSYEEFLEFHRKYYHPSNSYIYLYGDMDMDEKLRFIDEEYLSRYERLEIDSHIEKQQPFERMVTEKKDYPITDSESERDNTALAFNTVIGTSLDRELYLAFQVLDYALIGMPGAPLKQAILDAGIGNDVGSVYDNGIYQPYYSIEAKFANEEQSELFVKVIRETLEKIVRDGINKKTLEAGLNNMEFKYREMDFGRFPKGLMFGLQAFDSWLYDDGEPFMHIAAGETYASLRSKINTDYFEKLITKYILNNTHSSLIILSPKRGLSAVKEKNLKEKLAEYKSGLTDKEIDDIINNEKRLRLYQEEEESVENLNKIPLLKISDIDDSPRPVNYHIIDDGVKICHSEVFTSGITYLTFAFVHNDMPVEYIPYAGLLKSVLSYMDTDGYSYADLSNEINMYLGSMDFTNNIYTVAADGGDKYRFVSELSFKSFTGKLPEAFKLCEEVLLRSKFDDFKRLKEIIDELKSKLKTSINERGDLAASLRSLSYYSKTHYIKELISGIAYYKFIESIDDDFDNVKEKVAEKLSETLRYIFRRDNLIINHTGSSDSLEKVRAGVSDISSKLPEDRAAAGIHGNIGTPLTFVPDKRNEGFKTSAGVQYVARSGNYAKAGYEYTGSLIVLKNIMSSEYLWNELRVKGGAYGCGNSYSRQGDVTFTSYRDPHVARTNGVYDASVGYIKNFTADDREMRKFIIGTISAADIPLTPADEGVRNFTLYMSDITYEQLKKERMQILNTTVQDIRDCAPLIEAALADGYICAIGNESKIESDAGIFKVIKNMFC